MINLINGHSFNHPHLLQTPNNCAIFSLDRFAFASLANQKSFTQKSPLTDKNFFVSYLIIPAPSPRQMRENSTWQADPESRALPGLALCPDFTLVRADDPPGNGQP